MASDPQNSITFPSALAGMFGVLAVLLAVGERNADKIISFYSRALAWIARWLPLFYVPALVTLPLALNGIPGADLARIMGILTVGMVATLLFTAQTTVWIREAVKTPVKPIAKGKPAPPFTQAHFMAWGGIALAALAGGSCLHMCCASVLADDTRVVCTSCSCFGCWDGSMGVL